MREKRVHSKVISSAVAVDSDESPKSAKRDGKPATERPAIQDAEVALNLANDDRGRRRRLQDPLPLEESGRRRRLQDPIPLEESTYGVDGPLLSQQPSQLAEPESLNIAGGTDNVPLNPTHVPRSGYYFQHDDRSAPPGGRNNKRRTFDRSGWNDHRAKARFNDRFRDTSPGSQVRRRDDRRQGASQVVGQNKAEDVWHHDRFLEAQAEELEERRKPLTGEKGALMEAGKLVDKTVVRTELSWESKAKLPFEKIGNAEEQKAGPDKISERRYPDMNLARRERERYRERGEEMERGRWMESDQWNARFQSRGGYGRFVGGRDRLGARFDMNQRNSGSNRVVADKWKHDLFDDLNQSPTPKHEEDHVEQIEALLAA